MSFGMARKRLFRRNKLKGGTSCAEIDKHLYPKGEILMAHLGKGSPHGAESHEPLDARSGRENIAE